MNRLLVVLPLIAAAFNSCMQSAGAQPTAKETVATKPADREPVDQLFLDATVTRLQHAKLYTLAVAELMPESKYDFKPSPDEMSFAEQLLHIGSLLDWLVSQYIYKEEGAANPFKGPAAPYKKAEVIAAVSQGYDYAIEKIKHFNVANLTDSVYFEYMGAGRMSKLQYLNLMNDHQTHHRGQMMVYLRLNGIVPPEYIGW